MSPFKELICLHLKTRPEFKKKAIRHQLQEQTIKSRNKVIKPPPKEQPGDNYKNGKYLYPRMDHLCWAVLPHPVVHDIGQTTDHLAQPIRSRPL